MSDLRYLSSNTLDYQNQLIEERAEEIEHIEQQVSEINEIYRDLGELLRGQREHLDSIEEHIEMTKDNTADAAKDLKKAYEYGSFGACLTLGLLGAAVAGPVGFIGGIKSSVALMGLSASSGYLTYKGARFIGY